MATSVPRAVPTALARVRLLGQLQVWRADGTRVQPAESFTAQTADLLRLLALHVEEPVPVESVVEALWPTVDERRGRASLRTAASRLRKVIGEEHLQRRLGGMVLTGVWVDAHEFRALADAARRHAKSGALADAVDCTHQALSLYLGEFRSSKDGADWGLRERDALSATFRSMLADGAEAAATLGRWSDAVYLAEQTLVAEPCAERGFRALMRGQHGLGETPLALRTYDRCRRILADDFGTDPSAETQALYLALLADEPRGERPLADDRSPTGERPLAGDDRLPARARALMAVADPPVAERVGRSTHATRARAAVREADARQAPDAQARARAELLRAVSIPRREFASARRLADQALSLTIAPVISVEVTVAHALAGAALGGGLILEDELGRADEMLCGRDRAPDTGRDLAALRCLVAHDLGRPTYPTLHAAAAEHGAFDDGSVAQWIAIRVATESNDLAAAVAADRPSTPAGAEPVVRQLRDCASAALAVELGDTGRARALLLGVLALGRATGSTLAVPEALARLIMLDAHADTVTTRMWFEQFDECVGVASPMPRENVLRLFARSAMRSADDRPDDAASSAAAAADLAEDAGLVVLAAQAHRLRATHLTAAGKAFEARLALTAAARWQRSITALPGAASDQTLEDHAYGEPRLLSRRLAEPAFA